MDKENQITCCICGNTIDGYGHNSEPVNNGRCCDKCNVEVVIPRRKELMEVIKRGHL
jgi:hypothetical protein